jgi:hypothetical protein
MLLNLLHLLPILFWWLKMAAKSIQEFITEWKAVIGSDLAIQVRLIDGTVLKQTDNWIDEDMFLKMERQRFMEWQKKGKSKRCI